MDALIIVLSVLGFIGIALSIAKYRYENGISKYSPSYKNSK